MSPVEYLNNLEFVGSNSLYADETIKIWYNSKGYDSSVSYLNVLNNAILRSKINDLNLNPNNFGNIFSLNCLYIIIKIRSIFFSF